MYNIQNIDALTAVKMLASIEENTRKSMLINNQLERCKLITHSEVYAIDLHLKDVSNRLSLPYWRIRAQNEIKQSELK